MPDIVHDFTLAGFACLVSVKASPFLFPSLAAYASLVQVRVYAETASSACSPARIASKRCQVGTQTCLPELTCVSCTNAGAAVVFPTIVDRSLFSIAMQCLVGS